MLMICPHCGAENSISDDDEEMVCEFCDGALEAGYFQDLSGADNDEEN